jgi:ribosomal protein S18 acetylase RimI-like enzyme
MVLTNASHVRELIPADLPEIMRVQTAYAAVYSGAPVIPGEVYLSPSFEGGRNVFCGFDEAGRLLGYAPLFPVLIPEGINAPHKFWTEVKLDPEIENPLPLKDRLLETVVGRAREIAASAPGHPSHLVFQYFVGETAGIAYVLSRGCEHAGSIYQMARPLREPIPAGPVLPGLDVRCWRMESEAEQQAYVQAHNEAFPDAPMALGDWQHFMKSPQWAVGANIAAFAGAEVVGSVTVYWDEAENRSQEQKIGFTEHIFVRPAWRKRGIARRLILEGLCYLKERSLDEARLEVLAQNRQALRLYKSLGYRVTQESGLYVMRL